MECPNCHQPIAPEDLFCAACGHPLWPTEHDAEDDERTPPSLPFPLPASPSRPVVASLPQDLTLPDAATRAVGGTSRRLSSLSRGAASRTLTRRAAPLAGVLLLLLVTAGALATAAHSSALASNLSLAATASAATAAAAEATARVAQSSPTIDPASLGTVSPDTVESDASTQFSQASGSSNSISDWNAPSIYTPQAAPGGSIILDDACVSFDWSSADGSTTGAETMELMYRWDSAQQSWAFDFSNVLSDSNADCSGYTPYTCRSQGDPNCQAADAATPTATASD